MLPSQRNSNKCTSKHIPSMLYSEKAIELRKVYEEWLGNEDRLLDEYMSKIQRAWGTLKLTYRVPSATLGFKDDFDLFVELELESDTAWEKLRKADPLFYKEWRQRMDSQKAEWAEKIRNNQKDYEGRKIRFKMISRIKNYVEGSPSKEGMN